MQAAEAIDVARMPDQPVDAFDPPRSVPIPGAVSLSVEVSIPGAASTSGSASPSSARTTPGPATAGRADLARLLDEGEVAYRNRRSDAALAAFERVVALDSDHALAWLRIGNLHQQRRDWFKALGAYRRVAARSGGEGFDPALRAKALYNLAMINLELAQQTLRTLERIGPPATAAGPREPLSAAVSAARRRLEAFAPPGESAASQASATASQTSAPALRAPSGAVPRRAEPSRSEPESGLPRVDYIRGAPRP